MISNLRLIGIIIGTIGLVGTFLLYRGPKWNRLNFILLTVFNVALVMICINPDFVNFVRDILMLKASERGRIIALLILSNLFLLFYAFFTKSKVEHIRLQFDKLVRSLGTHELDIIKIPDTLIKPVMIIIPAYNEADNLKILLEKIPEKIDDLEVGVVVVDDGSTDGTAQVVEQMGCLVVSNRINRGQGAASRLGYDVLTKFNVSIGVTMDADNQHRPEELGMMIKPIIEDQYDLVIGSRTLGTQEENTIIRTWGITVFSKIISIAVSHKITDCSSGYKAFNMEKIKTLNLTEDQFQSAEVIIEARKRGLRIGEVPIRINRRRRGKSKKGSDWSYGFNFARTILKTWWRN
jgi:hypothetical protein